MVTPRRLPRRSSPHGIPARDRFRGPDLVPAFHDVIHVIGISNPLGGCHICGTPLAGIPPGAVPRVEKHETRRAPSGGRTKGEDMDEVSGAG